jgi:hypothetical protein
MRKRIGLLGILAVGFVFGIVCGHVMPVKAQLSNGPDVYIDYDSSPGIGSTKIKGTQVVGFSCVEEGSNSIRSTRCFIASIKP